MICGIASAETLAQGAGRGVRQRDQAHYAIKSLVDMTAGPDIGAKMSDPLCIRRRSRRSNLVPRSALR